MGSGKEEENFNRKNFLEFACYTGLATALSVKGMNFLEQVARINTASTKPVSTEGCDGWDSKHSLGNGAYYRIHLGSGSLFLYFPPNDPSGYGGTWIGPYPFRENGACIIPEPKIWFVDGKNFAAACNFRSTNDNPCRPVARGSLLYAMHNDKLRLQFSPDPLPSTLKFNDKGTPLVYDVSRKRWNPWPLDYEGGQQA